MSIPKRNLIEAPVFSIVLLHGLMAASDELKSIASKIYATFRDSVLIIQPTYRVGVKSVKRSIHHQAKELFHQIISEIAAYNKAPKNFPLIIIGYSQGGILACILGKIYTHQLYICGIITLHAPLLGTPLLERNHRDVKEFISNAEEGLQLIGSHLPKIKRHMAILAYTLTIIRSPWIYFPWVKGLKDITQNSRCIQDVNRFLSDANHNIPCLLIAGYQDSFIELFYKQKIKENRSIANLNNAYAQFITGNKEGQHDTLIPLSSQLCSEEKDLNNLSMITEGNGLNTIYMPMFALKQTNIERRIYKGIAHARNLVVIDPGLFIDSIETVLYSDQVLTDIVRFVKNKIKILV